MFLWATLIVWPFSFAHVAGIEWASISLVTWSETAYVVFFGTFVGYILIVNAQQVLRPTVIATYNYVQPLVAVSVALLMDIGVLKWEQALSVLLVFSGVWLVTKSKSRRDLEQTAKPSA
jgi:drug/metabolite transporter (DMT)-like permease